MDSTLDQYKSRIEALTVSLEPDTLNSRHGELETISMETNFWSDQNRAKAIMRELTLIEQTLEELADITSIFNNLKEYWELSRKETPEAAEKDMLPDLESLGKRISEFELRQFLSQPYDQRDAILSIHAGQGGTEANDWAEMLMRMYLRYAEKRHWTTEVLHMVRGDQAGIGTASIQISGLYAYGYLKGEHGTHRLVRISPFNSQGLRQTSFAGVEVLPVLEATDADDISIPDEEIEFKATKSGGPGGQNVNKRSTAVTITHKATGITIHTTTQRSQHQNREYAMRLLKAKLWELKQQQQQTEKSKLMGEHKIAGWGNQIRNYVLHPYKLVKDLRTNLESSNPEAVLDGDLDPFIEALLSSQSKA
jgi:peptide chain release factor 2